jgi:cytochrome c-type biogenesis protein CcmE
MALKPHTLALGLCIPHGIHLANPNRAITYFYCPNLITLNS